MTITVTGSDKLWDAFNELELAVRDKLLKRAMMATARRIESAAKDNVTRNTGALEASISIKTITRGTRGSGVRAIIGPKRGMRVPVNIVSRGRGKGERRIAIPTRYAHLIEFGHAIVVNGRVVGFVPPQSFMRRAWDSEGGDIALYNFADAMQKGIAQEVIRNAINSTSGM